MKYRHIQFHHVPHFNNLTSLCIGIKDKKINQNTWFHKIHNLTRPENDMAMPGKTCQPSSSNDTRHRVMAPGMEGRGRVRGPLGHQPARIGRCTGVSSRGSRSWSSSTASAAPSSLGLGLLAFHKCPSRSIPTGVKWFMKRLNNVSKGLKFYVLVNKPLSLFIHLRT